jgi:hypothetical protein
MESIMTTLPSARYSKKPGIEDPIYYWLPSIAPSGMAFVTSNRYPDWYGHLLIGSLKISIPGWVKLKGNEIIGRQKIGTDIGRLKCSTRSRRLYLHRRRRKRILKITPISMLTTKLTLGLAILRVCSIFLILISILKIFML